MEDITEQFKRLKWYLFIGIILLVPKYIDEKNSRDYEGVAKSVPTREQMSIWKEREAAKNETRKKNPKR